MKANVDEDTGRALDDEIIEGVRRHRGTAGYSDEFIDVFDFPQAELDEGYWSLMPPEELEVFRKLESEGDDRIEAVTDAVFQGIRTSANKIYIVDVLDADRVKSSEGGEVVTVIPTGESEEYEIETDLLRPFLQGDEIQRWRGDWSGLHVVHPYYAEGGDDGELDAGLYSQNYLREELPKTWEFFTDYKEELEAREGGRMQGRDDWYGYIYPKNLGKFETRKIIQAEIAEEATFMPDNIGSWYFTTGYGVALTEQNRNFTKEITCQLNSSALDFYLKHIAVIKAGGYYSYRTQYVENLPCITEDQDGAFSTIRGKAEEIVDTIDLDNKTDRFPEAYLGAYDGELDHIDYEWQTRRYPVDAAIQEKTDGRLAVTAGRSDEITDPLLDADDREENRLRAKYVHAAVDGRNVKSGEETTIPIPSQRDGVSELMAALADDEETVAETDIEELEAAIDTAVYDLFELTENERAVIEEYLEVF